MPFFAFELIVDRKLKKTEEQARQASCREDALQQALKVARGVDIRNIRRISKEEYDAITTSTPADRVHYYQPGNYLWPPPDEWAPNRRISRQE